MYDVGPAPRPVAPGLDSCESAGRSFIGELFAVNSKFEGAELMTVSIEIPDELERRLRAGWADLPRRALEALAIEAYRTETLTASEVGQLLGLGSRWEVEDFLNRNGVRLNYTDADLADDLKAIRSARAR